MRLSNTAVLATTMIRLCLAQDKPPTEIAKPKPPEETFYSQAQHAIVRLEHIEANLQTKLTNYQFATGFFVHTENNWYLVTAAHVADEPFSYTAKAPLLLDNGTTVDARVVLPHDKWEFPPEVDDKEHHFRMDVAAMKIRFLGGGLKSFNYCPKKCLENEYNQLDTDTEPPDVVMTFGFPGLSGMTIFSRPLGRQGMVAFVDTRADTISVENKWFDRHGFVIDMPTIAGGASGSPVIKIPALGRLTLVGLISASNTSLGGGYAIAEPVSRIRELLDRLENQKTPVVDPWCLATQDEAKKITNNTISICK
jgi:hypothetical protein